MCEMDVRTIDPSSVQAEAMAHNTGTVVINHEPYLGCLRARQVSQDVLDRELRAHQLTEEAFKLRSQNFNELVALEVSVDDDIRARVDAVMNRRSFEEQRKHDHDIIEPVFTQHAHVPGEPT